MNRLSKLLVIALVVLEPPSPLTSGPTEKDRTAKPRLKRMEIVGNHSFKAGQIQEWLGLRKNDPVSYQILQDRSLKLLNVLNARGFLFARIDSLNLVYNADTTKAEATVHLDEGGRPVVAKLAVTGLSASDSTLLDNMRTRVAKPFLTELLEADIEMLIGFYEAHGHPYVRAAIRSFDVIATEEQEWGVDILIDVERGPKVEVAEIALHGNEQTRDYVILRELPVALGDLYDERKVSRIQPQMMKLGYFEWVNPPKLEWLENGKVRLVIEMAEGNHNRFDGVLGYNPPAAGSDGFVTGLVDIRFGNLFGTGRLVDAHWQQRTADTQSLRFGYTEPWLAGLPLDLTFAFEQLIQDTSYVQRELNLGLSFLFSDNLSLFSRFGRGQISPDSLGALLFQIEPSTAVSVALGLSLNTTDSPLNPRHGLKYETSFEWRRKNIEPNENATAGTESGSFNQRRLTVDFESYFSLWRWQVLAVALHGREITTDEATVQLTDQYRFGGTRTLRGYREEQFRGSRVAWTNLEYRYLIGPRSRFFLFTDLGYFFREDRLPGGSVSKIDAFKVGYGFGLRLDTRLGFFGIDYGLGEGDGFSNGKVHIGLINEF